MSTNPINKEIQDLEHNAVRLAREQAETERKLAAARRQAQCTHTWDFPEGKYNPIVKPGYNAQDFMAPRNLDRTVWVEGTTTPQWTRTCKGCGRVENTLKSNTKIIQVPVF